MLRRHQLRFLTDIHNAPPTIKQIADAPTTDYVTVGVQKRGDFQVEFVISSHNRGTFTEEFLNGLPVKVIRGYEANVLTARDTERFVNRCHCGQPGSFSVKSPNDAVKPTYECGSCALQLGYLD